MSSHSDHTLGAQFSSLSTRVSPYPPSFDNSSWMYGQALFSLMCLAMFCSVIFGWMARDMWRDRFEDHPLSLAFLFRLMIATLSFVGLIRILPEVAMLTCWGEVTGATMSKILAIKRFADMLALPGGMFWMAILVLVYPYVMLAFKSQQVRAFVILDPLSIWPRTMRSLLIAALVALISALMSWAKWQTSAHG